MHTSALIGIHKATSLLQQNAHLIAAATESARTIEAHRRAYQMASAIDNAYANAKRMDDIVKRFRK